MHERNLHSFLALGYFLDYEGDFRLDLSNIDRRTYAGVGEAELVALGAEKLRRVVGRGFQPGRKHVVPLSGGLDSRAILGCLLELTDAEKIATYTFGTPGTLDYELGNHVARRFGTRHTALPLTQAHYSLDELLDVSRRIDHQTYLFHHPPVWEVDRLFGDHVVWSGFIGDFFVGSWLPSVPASEPDEARRRFLAKSRFVRSIELSPLRDEDLFPLLDLPNHTACELSLDEQIAIAHRLGKNTAPHVLMRGYEYRTPYVDPEWVEFTLSLEDRHRQGMRLWNEILTTTFSSLFSIGIKSRLGLPLRAGPTRRLARRALERAKGMVNRVAPLFVNPMLNYLDFDRAIRERADLRDIVRSSIMDLDRRQLVGSDLGALLRRHLDGSANHADALLVLTSLEVHLKAGASPR